ncbi:ATP-binding protein [Pseudodonghicola flavimaris]|uniref:histidine kinase n=1 Tax=Pseudodonghicola flavimaris TaxID=3050036 RepID=A0ABT7F0K5_9RHOB|nr:ATP-binding protein [Pseudodonghicola flavimaris]MDK3018146.1 ATP-binding protein [Pseudodonghicola flavimaris]
MVQFSQSLSQAFAAAVHLIWPEDVPDNRLETARRRFIVGFSLLGVCANLFDTLTAFHSMLAISPLRAYWSLWSTLLYLIPPLLIAWRGTATAAMWVLTAVVFVTINLQALSPQGHLWGAALYLCALPPLGTLLFGTRTGVLITVVSLTNVIVLGTLTVPPWQALILANVMALSGAGAYIFMREIEQTMTHLDRLRQEAQAANRAKSFFLANVSHEIRTPLNGVLGAVQLLSDHMQRDEERELLQTAEKSGQSLLRIVNDILDFARITEHGLTLDKRVFRRDDLVTNVFSALSSLAEEKGIALRASYGADVPLYLVGDPDRLSQIVMNFVSNAVKFSDRGTIEVRVARMPGTQHLQVAVRDEGIGLTHEAAQRIFNQFEQAENSTARHYGGTGLGLSIARHLAELHGGEIGVHSQIGKGSTFWFTFPLIEGRRPSEKIEIPATASNAVYRHARILLVEDNKTNQLIARKFLARLGITPVVAGDGAEAVLAANRDTFDLVFMDIQMPRKSGIEATQEIRSGDGPNRHTPIVALSANVMADQKESYFQAGMDGCLEKPCRFIDLVDCLHRFVPPIDDRPAAVAS